MGGLQHLLVDTVRLVVTLLVPAVVWLMLAAGLFQLALGKLRHVHIMPLGLRRPTREGIS